MEPHTTRKILAGLDKIPLFRTLSEKQKEALSSIAVERRFERGDIIFRQGTPSAGFYVIRYGEVNIHRLGPDGLERVIRIFHAGESFAEASLLPGANYPAHARAEADCSLLLIPRGPLIAVLERDADFALRMLVALSMRIHTLVASIESLRGENMRTRLLRWLLSRRPPVDNPNAYTIHLETTKAALAGELGMRQETLSRHLADLRNSGNISVKGRTFIVLQPDELRQQLNALEP